MNSLSHIHLERLYFQQQPHSEVLDGHIFGETLVSAAPTCHPFAFWGEMHNEKIHHSTICHEEKFKTMKCSLVHQWVIIT
jgi:hypothetical protein